MSDWSLVSLGEALDVKHGFAFQSEYFSTDLTGRPILVNIGNFSYGGGFRFDSTVNREYRGDVPPEFVLTPGDLLIIMTCQTAGGEILGVPAVVPNDGRIYLHNQRIGKVVIDPEQLDRRFAYYLFLAPSTNRQLTTTATGTKILHTSPERVRAVQVRLPNLDEQRAIAEVLSALDDKIDANRLRVMKAEDLAGTLVMTAAESTTVGTLAEIARRPASTDFLKGKVVDHFSLPAFDAGRVPVVEIGDRIKSGKFLLTAPAVLVSKLNPQIPRIWLAVPSGRRPAVTSTEFVGLVPRPECPAEVLWALCASGGFSLALGEMVKGTTGSHQRVAPEDVLGVRVPDPRVLGGWATDGIVAAVRLALSVRLESVQLEALRDALVPKLVSGELRIRISAGSGGTAEGAV